VREKWCLVFAGTLAALGQALIPYLTGEIIDFASIDPDRQKFVLTTLKLVVVSFACAIVTGVRGGLFTVAMTRLNVRIRTFLFASLLRQEISFYDTSNTGETLLLERANQTFSTIRVCDMQRLVLEGMC